MKKQFLLVALMIVTGICLSPFNKNSLKACVKDAAASPAKIKKKVTTGTAGYVEDADESFNMFMNPFTQL